MIPAVLADAGPLYAAVDPHDAQHTRALRDLQLLEEERSRVLVCFATLAEVYSLLLYRLGTHIALRWLDEMNASALVNPTPEDYRQAFTNLKVFADQRISLFDATVAAVATRLGVDVWTFDHDFDVMRIPVWRA